MNFKIYKKGQGKYTRLVSAAAVLLIVGFGCFRIYQMLEGLTGVSSNTKLWIQNLVPVVVFALFGLLVYWLLNKATIADFMINAEGEIKKVNWASRKEIAFSTSVVIGVVVFFAAFLGATDVIFQLLFRAIGLLPG